MTRVLKIYIEKVRGSNILQPSIMFVTPGDMPEILKKLDVGDKISIERVEDIN